MTAKSKSVWTISDGISLGREQVFNNVIPPVQITVRVSKLKDVLFERVFGSNLCLDSIPYTSIIEAMYALFGDTVTVEFIVSSLDDTPNLNELAR